MKRVVVLAALLLVGCKTTASDWQHVDAAVSDRQFVIDNGTCRQVAVGAAPMPAAVVVPNDRRRAYDVTARTTTIGPGGVSRSTTQGRITPAPDGFAGGFSDGLSDGAAIGAALRQSIDARNAQDEIYKGCMYRLGWAEAS